MSVDCHPPSSPSGDQPTTVSGSVIHLTPDSLRRDATPRNTRRFTFNATPWLGAKHDGLPFLNCIIDYHRRTSIDIAPTASANRAALAQSQLTFGLLEAVLEVKLSESLLVLRDEDGKKTLVDTNIPILLADWRRRIHHRGRSDDCRQWAQRVRAQLTMANRLIFWELTKPRSSAFRAANIPSEVHSAILLTCSAIGEALTYSSRVFPLDFMGRFGLDWTIVKNIPNPTDGAIKRAGWCPFFSSTLPSQSTLCAWMYASTRTPPSSDEPTKHASCSIANGCVTNNIDTTTYITRHVIPACKCMYVKPPKGKVFHLLQSGAIPVILYNVVTSQIIVSDASSTPYVAFSHVWVDGLGSTTEDGLPACQVRQLFTKARELAPSIPAFWIDSLCIPQEHNLRKQAIRQMAQTYKEASAVLVLDSAIRSCSIEAPMEDKLLWVLSAGWMRRLWTLQEALLARQLFFAFKDGIISIEQLLPRSEDDLCDCVIAGLSSEIFRLRKWFYLSSNPEKRPQNGHVGIGDVGSMLQWRSTSKAEDETLAIAGLLDVNPKDLLSVPSGKQEERMRVFLIQVGKLPANIIFMSVPKLSQVGFRWAPQTMMKVGGTMAIGVCDAVCTPTGLLAEYAMVYFPEVAVTVRGEDPAWLLVDNSKGLRYEATEVVVSTEGIDAEDPKATTSTLSPCTALLMSKLPSDGELAMSAAVQVIGSNPRETEEEKERIVFEFKRRVYLKGITEKQFQRRFEMRSSNGETLPVVEVKSGRVNARVT